MGSARDIRSAYTSNAVATAGPAQLLVMLLDRLVLDAERGQTALAASNAEEANRQLQHAQAIVTELQSTLEVDGMPAGRELLALYDYLQRQLIKANVARDQVAAAEAVKLSRELRDTWRQAALLAAASA
ncbi:flagellar export chaperone FliS [Nocardioides sp. CER19]|uniref:flagellar export chaperone FliS n=1 Tax=Nocardioides sp. CER19 TaxID=3038538 RepID=UPI002448FC24|nr:flagellar export chaperone FliS [Nocardioides sp. CER19]MDH2414643.1 flagellar export chaperone FliS [Nocardioides sp. CER19]